MRYSCGDGGVAAVAPPCTYSSNMQEGFTAVSLIRSEDGILPNVMHYENDNGKISVCPPFFGTMDLWEIYVLESAIPMDCSGDVERFDTEEEALTRVRQLLKIKQSQPKKQFEWKR